MTNTDQLDVDIIEDGLSSVIAPSKVLVYRSTSSTNNIAWEYANNPANNGLAVFAEEQTRGRGRMGNKWLSAPGQSILCSILLLDFDCPCELMATVSAVAAAEAIIKTTGLNAKIKWPNDVMINGKKTAGILLESQPGKDANNYVIGVGLNCHQPAEFFENNELQMPATSLDIETESFIDRNKLAINLLRSFGNRLNNARQNSARIIEEWKSLSSQLGHRVTVKYNQQQFSGNCIGVDPAAGLILHLDKGGVRMFEAAQTTIVKHM